MNQCHIYHNYWTSNITDNYWSTLKVGLGAKTSKVCNICTYIYIHWWKTFQLINIHYNPYPALLQVDKMFYKQLYNYLNHQSYFFRTVLRENLKIINFNQLIFLVINLVTCSKFIKQCSCCIFIQVQKFVSLYYTFYLQTDYIFK